MRLQYVRLQYVSMQVWRSRRFLALPALVILALFAINQGTGYGQTAPEPSLNVTADTDGAVVFHPDRAAPRRNMTFNVEEGQVVTYTINLATDNPPPDTTDLTFEAWCYCIYDAGFVSYKTGAGTDAEQQYLVEELDNYAVRTVIHRDAFPIEFKLKGLRVSRRARYPDRQVPRLLDFSVTWRRNGKPEGNDARGWLYVSERTHPADESTHRFVRISNAADVMKGEDLTYNVQLVDKDGNAMPAAQDINLSVNTWGVWHCCYPDPPSAGLTNEPVIIAMGTSSATFTVRTVADVRSRPVELIYAKAWLTDHPPGIKFWNPLARTDAIGQIVEGTAFAFVNPAYGGGEGDAMPIVIRVDGKANAGEFVLRLNFSVWSPLEGYYAADLSDLGGATHYDCRINPTRRGEHRILLPLHQDDVPEPSEVFLMHLSMVSAPEGEIGRISENNLFGQNRAWGWIHERTTASKLNSTNDCVAVTAPGSVPSSVPASKPLRSPISFNTNEIALTEGSSFSYDVTLKSDPGGQTVTVTPISSDEDTIESPAPIAFDSSNWDQPQQVVVSASADADDEDDAIVIGHHVEGVDDDQVATVVFATVTEQPTLGLDLRQPTQRSFGDQPFLAYWVRLDRQPSSEVEIELTPASDSVGVRLHTDRLSFSAENWDRYQIVVLKPLDGAVGSEVKISHSSASHHVHSGESVSATVSGG